MICQKLWPPGAWLFVITNKKWRSTPLKLVVRIQNNLVEIVTGSPSKTNIDLKKNMAARGRGQFPLCTYGKTLKKSSPPVVRIENNLAEMVTR